MDTGKSTMADVSNVLDEDDEQYTEFREKKKRRKVIENLMPENWELGKDKELYSNGHGAVSTSSSPKKRIKVPSSLGRNTSPVISKSNRRKKKISKEFEEKILSGKYPNKKVPIPTNETTIDAHLKKKHVNDPDIRPLEEWLITYGTRHGKELSELTTEVEKSIESGIKKTMSQGTHRPIPKADTPKRKIPIARRNRSSGPATEKKRKREQEEVDTYFSNDKDTSEEPFGMVGASTYKIFQQLYERRKDKDNLLGEIGSSAIDNNCSTTLTLPVVEECSKAYCTDFLREPIGLEERYGERPCRAGQDCIFVALSTRYPDSTEDARPEDGFVCREFLLPSQLERWKREKILPDQEQLCLGCNRMLTTYWYYLYRYKGEEPVEILQDHCNTVDQEGEYDMTYCIYPNPTEDKWSGLSRPVVKFSKETYVYCKMKLVGEKSKREFVLKCVRETKAGFR